MAELSDSEDIYASYGNLDADKVLSAYGKYGHYQLRTYLIANLVHMIYAINMLIVPFISEDPEFRCQIDPNEEWDYTKVDECTVLDSNNWTISCTQIPGAFYNYSNRANSISAEFDLICKDQGSAAHATSLYVLGGMLATPLFNQLSDWYGRRPALLLPFYLSFIATFICGFAPNFTVFLIGRFLLGMMQTSVCSTAATLSLESVSIQFRSFLPLLINFFFIAGYFFVGLLKLYLSKWRWLLAFSTLPALLFIPFFSLLPESLHWMVTMKKYEGIKKYIDTAGKFNKKQINLSACETLCETKPEGVKRSILDAVTVPALLFILIVHGYLFVVMNFTYWSLSLFSTDLSSDKMTGYFLSGAVEIPAAIIANLLIQFLNRKSVSLLSLLIACSSMVALCFVPQDSIWKIVFPLATKFATVIFFANETLHCCESAPTSVRGVFIGVVVFISALGGILAPYLKHLSTWDQKAPNALIALLSFFAILGVLSLPETRDQLLPEDLNDVDPGPVFGRCIQKKKRSEEEEESEHLHNNVDY